MSPRSLRKGNRITSMIEKVSAASGSDFKRRREALGVSQFKLARASQIASQVISQWERGTSAISLNDLKQLESTLQSLAEQLKQQPTRRKNFRPRSVPRTPPPPPPLSAPIRRLEPRADAPKVLAAFAGCGGMSEGFFQAGFDLVGHIELNPHARRTYEVNFPDSRCLGEDINSVDFGEITQRFPEGSIDVVIGGPPCQGFSLAGKRQETDPRNRLFEKLIDLADAVRPKFVVMENVLLLTSMRNVDGGLVIEDVMARFRAHGYEPSVHYVNAADYGVAQSRKRIFVVAIRRDENDQRAYSFPEPTHGKNMLGLQPVKTFFDVTRDLERIESGEHDAKDPLHWAVDHPPHVIDMLRDVPPGGSAHDNPDPDKRPSSGYNTTYKRIRWDQPSSTVSTNFSMISGSRNVHPEQTRSITIREASRAQSFPDEFRFVGPWGEIRTMIGNAVPPLLAKAVAESLLKRLGS